MMNSVERLNWFKQAKYGLFIHWGPYAEYGRGEQVLLREHMDQQAYSHRASQWNPQHFDAESWADTARKAGMKYAVLTTRHHDGYCLWDSQYTDYTSASQAPGRDFVRDFVDAFRNAGLRIGLYYSWMDCRIPAFFSGPTEDAEGWAVMKRYLHNQVEELLTTYGRIDLLWFDGAWPRTAEELGSPDLIRKIRTLQPDILINNRLGRETSGIENADGGEGSGESTVLGDFGTPERGIVPVKERYWEACMVPCWRLWGYARGEQWRSAGEILSMLCECAEKGGNLLLNVGPQPDGTFPPAFTERALAVGDWLQTHGEAIWGVDGGDVTEFVTRGIQTVKGYTLYLIIRFWDGEPTLHLPDLTTAVKRVELITTGRELSFIQDEDGVLIQGLPHEAPSPLFPVIRVECADEPTGGSWAQERLWSGNPKRYADWARTRPGSGVWMDGRK